MDLHFDSFRIRLKNGHLCVTTLVAVEIRELANVFEPGSFNDKSE